MKNSFLRRRFARFAELLRTALTGHPVELLILLHATASACASVYHLHHAWMHPAVYAPFAVIAALSLSFYRERHRWAVVAYWAMLCSPCSCPTLGAAVPNSTTSMSPSRPYTC